MQTILQCQKDIKDKVTKLHNFFFNIPHIHIGRLSLAQWSEAMESVTNFKLPWRLLREKLAVVNENNEILYDKTLQMIENDDIVSNPCLPFMKIDFFYCLRL